MMGVKLGKPMILSQLGLKLFSMCYQPMKNLVFILLVEMGVIRAMVTIVGLN
jgi:hypothetical protein